MTAIAARDIIFRLIKIFCDSESIAVHWPDQPFEKPDTGSFARVVMRHAVTKQAALMPVGTRLWESSGIASVTFFCPIASGGVSGYTLAQDMISSLRASSESVWFRNIKLRELGSEGAYQQVQVLWDFEYRDQE